VVYWDRLLAIGGSAVSREERRHVHGSLKADPLDRTYIENSPDRPAARWYRAGRLQVLGAGPGFDLSEGYFDVPRVLERMIRAAAPATLARIRTIAGGPHHASFSRPIRIGSPEGRPQREEVWELPAAVPGRNPPGKASDLSQPATAESGRWAVGVSI
jgi:hypothetical protein